MKLICVTGSYVTVPSPVVALIATTPLLNHVVIVHPVVVQFFPPSPLLQNLGPVTPPGAITGAEVTTAFVANAVLFVVFESPGFEIERLNVTFVHHAAGSGITGIRKISSVSGRMVVVLVQVTVVPTCAPHDHQLSTNALVGPVILVGIVSIAVCTPLDERFPTFDTLIGICDTNPVVSGHSGCPIPGIRSTTLLATYGASLHSSVPEYVVGVVGVQKSQLTPNPKSPPVVCTLFVKLAPLAI